MGVLRKKPGDKVEISPIKLWGIVSLVALCLGFGAALIGRASAQPIPSFITGENMSQENQVLDGTYVYREGCPESEDSRLRSVCGTVLSAKLEQEKGISDTFTTVTKPVENISVYAYEFDPDTDTGFDEFGRLERPFASTSTNEAGKYHLQYRASGSKNSLIANAIIATIK